MSEVLALKNRVSQNVVSLIQFLDKEGEVYAYLPTITGGRTEATPRLKAVFARFTQIWDKASASSASGLFAKHAPVESTPSSQTSAFDEERFMHLRYLIYADLKQLW